MGGVVSSRAPLRGVAGLECMQLRAIRGMGVP